MLPEPGMELLASSRRACWLPQSPLELASLEARGRPFYHDS